MAGCAVTPTPTQNEGLPDGGSGEAPVQPIHFEEIEEAVDLIRKSDLDIYTEEEQLKYKDMFDFFETNNFAVPALADDSEFEYEYGFMTPYSDGGDYEIGNFFYYKGERYRVIIYYFKSDLKDIAANEGLLKYWDTRHNNVPFTDADKMSISYNGKNIDAYCTDVIRFIADENVFVCASSGSMESLDNIKIMLNEMNVSYLTINE